MYIKNSFVASKCLSVLAITVSSHFALTPGQVAHLRDPIVSVGNQELHFEAFSSCNSVYSRIKILRDGTAGEFLHSGCTNIDLNDETIRALNTVSKSEKLILGIGSKEVTFITERDKSIEKKVKLPNRWIKGLGNVQLYLSEMELAYKLTKIQALHLFKSLPKAPVKSSYYLNRIVNNFTFSPVRKSDSIEIGGIHRLNLLSNLILLSNSLFIYSNGNQQSFALVLDFKDIQMTFLFSNSVYRGFSGEGKHLGRLTQKIPNELISGFNKIFKTNEVFNATLIGIENDIDFNINNDIQSFLSSIGLLGFNLLDNNHFYRRLPFKTERLLNFNPRLKNARKIITNKEVSIVERTTNQLKAKVKGSGGIYHIVLKTENTYQCTCNWYTNNQNNRGVCKHILAVMIVLEE